MIEVAKKAAELVASIRESQNKIQEEYLRTIRGLGSLVIQNGLAGAILFTIKKESKEVVEHLDQLIEIKTGVSKLSKKIEDGDIYKQKYLQIQIAALDCIKWLKRYAEILLGGDSA
ncbi:MAG TPA: type III-B CRISPR module-associated protein Cmr5 [Pseudothermotoga sp.]